MLDITYAMAMTILPYIQVQYTAHKVVPIAPESSFSRKVGCAQEQRTNLKKLEEVLKDIVTQKRTGQNGFLEKVLMSLIHLKNYRLRQRNLEIE